MRDCIDIGSAPPMEDCAQVGRPDYEERARRECRVYLALLRRTLGDEPLGARLSVKYCPHDFGTYVTVCCYFDDTEAAAVDYAFACEGKGPECWDDQARQELQQAAGKAGKEKTP